jgi:hypothetical protein
MLLPLRLLLPCFHVLKIAHVFFTRILPAHGRENGRVTSWPEDLVVKVFARLSVSWIFMIATTLTAQ